MHLLLYLLYNRFLVHTLKPRDRLRVGRGTTRAEDAQGTPTQTHISPSILVYEENPFFSCAAGMVVLGDGRFFVPLTNIEQNIYFIHHIFVSWYKTFSSYIYIYIYIYIYTYIYTYIYVYIYIYVCIRFLVHDLYYIYCQFVSWHKRYNAC